MSRTRDGSLGGLFSCAQAGGRLGTPDQHNTKQAAFLKSHVGTTLTFYCGRYLCDFTDLSPSHSVSHLWF